jgi:hypothetical protein
MKVTKSAVYRITTATGCGCQVVREYEDADYKKPLGETHTFTECAKHKGQPGVDVIEMILGELVEKEAADHVPAPVQPTTPAPRPGASAVVNENGELEMRVPIKTNPIGRSSVHPSGTSPRPAAPGRPVNAAQAARTGPVAAPRPTRPVGPAPAAPARGLSAALAESDEEEDDILAANDPERAY